QIPMPEKLKHDTIFFEDFNIDHDTNWAEGRNDINFIDVKNGVFYYENIKLNIQATPFPVEFDTGRNFEMEFRAKAPANKKDLGVFFWGRESEATYHSNYWYFRKNGRSHIFSVSDSSVKSYRLRKKIKEDAFNVYTIRKWNHLYYIYVNNHLVK